jgi:hypothetical protein
LLPGVVMVSYCLCSQLRSGGENFREDIFE